MPPPIRPRNCPLRRDSGRRGSTSGGVARVSSGRACGGRRPSINGRLSGEVRREGVGRLSTARRRPGLEVVAAVVGPGEHRLGRPVGARSRVADPFHAVAPGGPFETGIGGRKMPARFTQLVGHHRLSHKIGWCTWAPGPDARGRRLVGLIARNLVRGACRRPMLMGKLRFFTRTEGPVRKGPRRRVMKGLWETADPARRALPGQCH